MNFPRVALAGLAAWLSFCAIGYLSHGILMRDLYLAQDILRPEADAHARLPLAFAASFVGFLAFAYAYAKGYEGGRGVQEGLRYGVLIGVMLIAFAVVWDYMSFRVTRPLFFAWVIDHIVEYAIYGSIVGAIYKPRTPARV